MNFVRLSCICPENNANCCAEWNEIYIADVGANDMEENKDNVSVSTDGKIKHTDILCAQTLVAMGELLDDLE